MTSFLALFAAPRLVNLAPVHANAWWGALLLVLGIFNTLHFPPRRRTP